MTSQINSIVNLIANILLLVGGYTFYVHYITREMKWIIYHTMRFCTALLITGAFSRVLFDINILYTGINKNFDVLEAAIALNRNIGLGGILIYLTNKFKN